MSQYIVELRHKIKEHSLSLYSKYFESYNFHQHPKPYAQAPKKIRYSYQRYDLRLSADDWLNALYGLENIALENDGLFVKSGMSAFLTIFLTLKRFDPSLLHVALSTHGYFEIEEMLAHHTHLFKIQHFSESMEQPPDIAILDSTAILPKQHLWSQAKILIIDTTLWEANSLTLRNLLEKMHFKGIILLLRSHIKLDCFGLEVNRLGSIVAVKKQEADFELKKFKMALHETACNIGCNFNIDDFYPWLFKKEFHHLCKIRTEQIKFFTRKIYQQIVSVIDQDDSSFEFSTGQHDLFVVFKFKKSRKGSQRTFNFSNPVQRYARSIASMARAAGLPIIHSASFGLCCTSIDGHLNKEGNAGYLRLAPTPNMNLEQAEKISDFIVRFCKK